MKKRHDDASQQIESLDFDADTYDFPALGIEYLVGELEKDVKGLWLLFNRNDRSAYLLVRLDRG